MYYSVLPVGFSVPRGVAFSGNVYLLEDQWDDWFRYETLYQVFRIDQSGEPRALGGVKIGEAPWSSSTKRPNIPFVFYKLPHSYFSLGQGEGYYEALGELGAEARDEILRDLRDMAFDLSIYSQVRDEDIVENSLMRDTPEYIVRDQLSRVAHGGRRLTAFRAQFKRSYTVGNQPHTLEIDLSVQPDVQPPTNVQVVIGRNGAGKTQLLRQMAQSLMSELPEIIDDGDFLNTGREKSLVFERMVYVSFSAFDTVEPFEDGRNEFRKLSYYYVGLKKISSDDLMESGLPRGDSTPDSVFGEATNQRVLTRSSDELASNFVGYFGLCMGGRARIERWRSAVGTLSSDPLFADLDVGWLSEIIDEGERDSEARSLFLSLSSGHKIVLLVLTSLVALVEEKTLVIIDEPEGHLHPPLLASFVRALSDLLVNRNGVAIVATHSPVVLQEVPRKCVHTLWRTGEIINASRPSLETFGENVGILTTEVFGLETSLSGFHRRLLDAVTKGSLGTYDKILEEFGGQLGGEARALLQAMLSAYSQDGHPRP